MAGRQGNEAGCWPAWGYAKAVKASWKWSVQHPRDSQRQPVPYPRKAKSPKDGRNHVVYVVFFEQRKIWKFGITRHVPWTKRANEGRRACEKAQRGSCRVDWVAVSDKRFYNARFLEASLIKGYERDNDNCPPGQRTSCR